MNGEGEGGITGVYEGARAPQHIGRDGPGYDDTIEDRGGERLGTYKLIISAIQEAKARGRKRVTIFDFGCGEGNMLRGALSDSEVMQAIRADERIQVDFIGLTDTPHLTDPPTNDEIAHGKNILPNDAPPNVSARIDYGAITEESPLEQYFIDKGITEVDRGFAIESLQYIPDEILGSTLESIITRLQSPGATLITTGMMVIPPFFGWGSLFDGSIYGYDAGQVLLEPGLQATLVEKGMRFKDPRTDIDQEIQNLKIALERYLELEGLTQDQIDTIINQHLPEDVRDSNTLSGQHPLLEQIPQEHLRDDLEYIANSLLNAGQDDLAKKQKEESEKKRKKALADLTEKYGNDFDFVSQDGDSYLRVTKK